MLETSRALPTDYKGEHRFIQVSFQSGGGLSGGCLIDKSGHVLGVMTENIYLVGAQPTSSDENEKNRVDEAESADDSDSTQSGLPRPYGQAVPIEYVDSFIHGERLTAAAEPAAIDLEVFAGVPPAWYKEGEPS